MVDGQRLANPHSGIASLTAPWTLTKLHTQLYVTKGLTGTMTLRILALSPVGAYRGFNTSAHRIAAMRRLGHEVEVVDSHPTELNRRGLFCVRVATKLFRKGLPIRWPDLFDDRSRLLTAAAKHRWDLVWLEKALTLDKAALRNVKLAAPGAVIVGFSPDDMNARHNQSQQFIDALPAYDVFATTKTYNVSELQARGCPCVVFVGNGFDPQSFRPISLESHDHRRYEADVSFIGTYEKDRADSMLFLARNGVRVRVWGGMWERMRQRHPNLRLEMQSLHGDAFSKACGASKINLGFLRKVNRDQQTTRSVEIPACGGFMLAERTSEHRELFQEGVEAEFFSSNEELLRKVRFYLDNSTKRKQIAAAGLARCLHSGYRNEDRLAFLFSEIQQLRRK